MKYYVMRNNIIPKLFAIFDLKLRQVTLGPIKFIRMLLAVKDDFYNRHIVKFDLFKPIFKLLEENKGKDNMIVSAIVEIIEYIRVENLHVLIEYIVENYAALLEKVIDHVDTFEKLSIRYDQIKDGQMAAAVGNGHDNNSKQILLYTIYIYIYIYMYLLCVLFSRS